MKTIKYFLLAVFVPLCGCMNKGAETNVLYENVEPLPNPLDSIPSNKFPVHECVSEDGNMKFYSWNTGEGGTMPIYGLICQFRTKDGKYRIIDLGKDDIEEAWVSSVHSIHKDDGSTYYIVERSHRISSNDGYMWMDAFKIDGDSVKYVNVIDGSEIIEEQKEDGFSVNYDISHWDDTTNGEAWDWLFEYDTDSRDLYVPLTDPRDYLPHINDRYRVFHFNGKRFVEKGVTCNKGLNGSLADYVTLLSYFRTKNYIVRIDSLVSGDYRYASWKATSTMKDKPELVIVGNEHDLDANSYTFLNDGVEYIVGYKEEEPAPEGSYLYEFLLVRKNGKVILKEEKERAY